MSSSTSDDTIDIPPGVTRDSNNRFHFENRFISATDVQDMMNSQASGVDESLTLEEAVEEANLNADSALVAVHTPTHDELYSFLLQAVGKINELHAEQISFRQWTVETITGVQENTVSLIDTSAQLKIGFNRIQASTNEMQAEIEHVCEAFFRTKGCLG